MISEIWEGVPQPEYMNYVDTEYVDRYRKDIELNKLVKLTNLTAEKVLMSDHNYIMKLYTADCANKALEAQINNYLQKSKNGNP